MSDNGRLSRRDRLVESAVGFLHDRPFLVLALLFLLTVAGAYLASRLELRSNFSELLPENSESVKDLDRLMDRLGGTGNLILVLQSSDREAMKRGAEDLVRRIEEGMPPGLIRYVDYKITKEREYFEKNRFLFMDLADLETIRDRLKKKIDDEVNRRNPLFISLEPPMEFDISEIVEKYREKASVYDKYRDGYYFSKDGLALAILVKPFGQATGIEFVRRFMERLHEVLEGFEPGRYAPDMTLGIAGNYHEIVEEFDSLVYDMVSTLAICVTLVVVVIFAYYRRFRMILLLVTALGTGVVWTFALTFLKIGYLNSQTAFLGSIIVGNGINNGLIFLARYVEERRRAIEVRRALIRAVRTTMGATATAALTTSVAFAALLVTDFRGYNQFGFIGGLGMVLCWLSTYLVLPPLLTLTERIRPLAREGEEIYLPKPLFSRLLNRLAERAGAVVILVAVLLAAFGAAIFPRILADPFEYDFTKIRSESVVKSGSGLLNRKMAEIFDLSLTPAVVLAENPEEAYEITKAVIRRRDADPSSTIETAKSLYSFLPDRQEEKLAVLKEIRRQTERETLKFAKGKQLEELEKLRDDTVNLGKISVEDMPETIRRHFVENNGDLGKLVYIFPKNSASLWNGRNTIKFSGEIRKIELPSGKVVNGTGESVIIADILRLIMRDGPKATLASFIGVLCLLLINFRSVRVTGMVVLSLLGALAWMSAGFWIFGMKINFFNFMVLPMAIGIGIDYAVNIFHRYEQEGEGSIDRVLESTGGAVLLCSLTTIIGYAAMLSADNQALRSFGYFAILGEFSCIAMAAVITPTALRFIEKRRGSRAVRTSDPK